MIQVRTQFRDQAGLRMFSRARKLIGPPQLEPVMIRLIKTELRPGTADNDVNAIHSTAGGLPEGYMVMDFLTCPFAWFLLTNIDGLSYMTRIAFETDMQVDFVTDNLLVKAYERYSFAYYNPRAGWASLPDFAKEPHHERPAAASLSSPPSTRSLPGTHVSRPAAGRQHQGTGTARRAWPPPARRRARLPTSATPRWPRSARVTQAASPGQAAGVFVSPDLIIPAQSMILRIASIVLVAFTGAASTFGIGNTVNPIAFTPAGAMTAPADRADHRRCRPAAGQLDQLRQHRRAVRLHQHQHRRGRDARHHRVHPGDQRAAELGTESMRKSRSTGGRDLRDTDRKHHEFTKDSKVIERSRRRRSTAGRAAKEVGGIAGAHARATGGRAPRKDGGRTGADSHPFSSARSGTGAPGRSTSGGLGD